MVSINDCKGAQGGGLCGRCEVQRWGTLHNTTCTPHTPLCLHRDMPGDDTNKLVKSGVKGWQGRPQTPGGGREGHPGHQLGGADSDPEWGVP